MVRSSKFELLRILAMFMIIAYHYEVHGCKIYIDHFDWTNRVIVECFSMFGKVGVNLFVLITGYFSIQVGREVSKLLKMELETIFFSTFLLIVSISFIGMEVLSASTIAKTIAPVIFNSYWFITSYVILWMFIPYINKLLWALSKEEVMALRRLILILWCLIPTITFQVKLGMNWTQQIWMMAMYVVGASLRISPLQINHRVALLISFTMLIGSVIGFEIIGERIAIVGQHATYFRWSNTIIAVIVSLSMFLTFVNMQDFHNSIINRLARSAVSVYLFHEHHVFSTILWDVLGCWKVGSFTPIGVCAHILFCILIIYIVGAILHFLFDLFYGEFIQNRTDDIIKRWKIYLERR